MPNKAGYQQLFLGAFDFSVAYVSLILRKVKIEK